MATDNFWGKFRHWRRRRPFWGGLLLLLSGVELFLSGNMTIGGLEIHLGPTGFLSYLLPLILVACALLVWFNPTQRLFYAIVALLAALYSFIGLNLGGFFIGMLLGIIGGGLTIAWGPPRPRPGTEVSGPPTGEPSDHQEDGPVDVGDDIFNQHQPRDIDETQRIDIAGHDDRPHVQQSIRPAGHFAEPPAAEPSKTSALQRLARNPRALALALIPLAVVGTIVVASSNLPASADSTCPDGLPSIATTTTAAAAAAAKKTTAVTAKKTTAAAAKKTAAGVKTTAAAEKSTAATPTTAATTSGGNAVVDGIKDVVDGVGNLLGIGDESSASPSTSPATSETTAPATTAPTTAPAESSSSATTEPTGTATADPTKTTGAASPTSSDDVIPCLGPRIIGKVAGADDIPVVAQKPGLLEVDLLTLYNSTYDGVVEMPTAGGGSFKALKFSMDKAVNKPFKLTIDEKAGNQTVITSKELTTSGTVKLYTTELKGNLFGVIPVTFTPDQPPPLTLPVLWFTDVTAKLAYVRCDTLTGDPLKIKG